MTGLVLVPARPDEVPTYLEMRDAAAEAMVAAGIVQWRPGELTAAFLLDWLGDGRLLLARLDGELVGGVMVMWADPMFWGDRDDDAGYVHDLLLRQGRTGGGIGRRMLALAEDHIRDHGRGLVRLDTVTTNTRLRRYYRDAGYVEVGQKVFDQGAVLDGGAPVGAVTLFEKRLAPP